MISESSQTSYITIRRHPPLAGSRRLNNHLHIPTTSIALENDRWAMRAPRHVRMHGRLRRYHMMTAKARDMHLRWHRGLRGRGRLRRHERSHAWHLGRLGSLWYLWCLAIWTTAKLEDKLGHVGRHGCLRRRHKAKLGHRGRVRRMRGCVKHDPAVTVDGMTQFNELGDDFVRHGRLEALVLHDGRAIGIFDHDFNLSVVGLGSLGGANRAAERCKLGLDVSWNFSGMATKDERARRVLETKLDRGRAGRIGRWVRRGSHDSGFGK
ncbi:hypothetical protein BCR44DRAFT_1442430 [Catenaria anguillulae PL171]|uniref:Uncharacterized protein n=1 Tax=Catenaria anguillulae PL171 TaxID=765915 RepID=A0A1Y2H9T0_9FUNG|nr:hypothetical protein BCR44DRAFT_1442430 [Catenaria anguillulae PL171]